MSALSIETIVLILLACLVGVGTGYALRWISGRSDSASAPVPDVSPNPASPQTHDEADKVPRTTVADNVPVATDEAPATVAATRLAAEHPIETDRHLSDNSLTGNSPTGNAKTSPGMTAIASQIQSIEAEPSSSVETDAQATAPWSIASSSEEAAMATSEAVVLDQAPDSAQATVAQDLTLIHHIDLATAAVLQHQGITRYEQIAALEKDNIERLNKLLGVRYRIETEDWIGQARILDAQRAGADAAACELIRDDLRRIRGISEAVQSKLYQLGFQTYRQIANWSFADVERVSKKLNFNGRIERENWIEQARILSSGGQTEFSQRFDQGDIKSVEFGIADTE